MLRECKEALAGIEQSAEKYALEIKRFMGHADTLLGPDGKKLATWSNRKGPHRLSISIPLSATSAPEPIPAERALFIEDAKRAFTTRGEPGRTFTLK
jgi:hypothetical protein